jgi:beta-lactamase regulating signal transducer with metallopeptidase domain
MSHFAGWISPDVMRTLGWALVHFLWQGIAAGALAAMAMAVCRSAAVRYAVGVGALVLMLAAPVGTFVALWQSRLDASPQGFSTATASAFAKPVAWWANASSGSETRLAANATRFSSHPDALLWFVEAWFAGVVILSLRTAGGVLLIERMRRTEAKPVSARLRQICVAVQWRLGLMRAIRYCESKFVAAPAVIGWIRPAVLLPVSALSGLSEEQLQAVIAHELAHIRRFDNIVNAFQILVETLLFYHPAVWWLSKRIRVERENCCDDAAVSVCSDPMQYAKALATMAELRAAPALAMAANRGPLAARVARLLGASRQRSSTRNVGVFASFILLASAALAANAFFGIAHSALASGVPVPVNNFKTSPPEPFQASASMPTEASGAGSSRAAAGGNSSIAQTGTNAEAPATARVQQEQKPQQGQTQEESSGSTGKTSYIEAMKAVGFDNLTVDQLVALKSQGVTAEYIRELHDLGLKPSVDEVIGLKVQGVTPDYIRDMRAAGVSLDAEKIIGMRVQGITPEYVRGMHDLGIEANGDELIGLKVQGVTPEYIKQMHDLGIAVKADELIGMRVQGITPDYVRAMHDLGIPTNADELIGMKVQGITPEYIKQMHDLGMSSKADDLIGMKVQGVTPEYIQQMRALGLKLDADQIIGMRVQGVTPEYVKAMRATGLPDFKDDPDCYIGAKVQGITPEFITEVQKHGFKDLDLDKLIALKNAGVF